MNIIVNVQVEVLLPEFWDPGSGPIFAEEGDQQRFWKLTRRFMENLAQGTGSSSIKAVRITAPPRCSVTLCHVFCTGTTCCICQNLLLVSQVYPDMGVAAMLKNQWPEVAFKFASLSDRKPVSEEDELVVLAAPDPQSEPDDAAEIQLQLYAC